MKVTNIAPGPRGINAVQGQFVLNPKESRDLDIVAAEAKIARGTGWFQLEGDPFDAATAGNSSGQGNEADQAEREALKKEAETLGLEFARNITTSKLKELVEAKKAAAGNSSGQQ